MKHDNRILKNKKAQIAAKVIAMSAPTAPGLTVICKHCAKPINQAMLRGISLICPLCGKPQNGQLHLK